MDEYGVDLGEIERVIQRAEVLIVRFQVVEPRLLLDFRTSDSEGPLIQLVPRANSVEERFRSLKTLRPSLPVPERILSFLWPRSIAALERAGVVETIRKRLLSIGGAQQEEACATTFAALRDEERGILRAAIRGGEGFQTIWERSA